MVVNYFYLLGSVFRPTETHPILVVDPYAVLAFSVPS
jgi:hypothetical protein